MNYANHCVKKNPQDLFEMFSLALLARGISSFTMDPNVFNENTYDGIIILAIYVDHILNLGI